MVGEGFLALGRDGSSSTSVSSSVSVVAVSPSVMPGVDSSSGTSAEVPGVEVTVLATAEEREVAGNMGVLFAIALGWPYIRSISTGGFVSKVSRSRKGFSLTGILEEDEERKLGCMGGQTDEQYGIAARNERKTIISGIPCNHRALEPSSRWQGIIMHTDGVHWVWCQFEDAIEDKVSSLKETVSPIPAVVFHNVMGLGLNPEVESNERNTSEPSETHSLFEIWTGKQGN